MKNLFFSMLIILVLCSQAIAADSIKFIWEANDPSEEITGYKLYKDCGSEECVIANIVNPATNTITIPAPTDRIAHSYSLTAYKTDPDNSTLESDQSDYAIYVPPKVKPSKRTLTTIILR